MIIKSLSSGSHANCYLVSNDKGGDRLMIEAGLSPNKLKKALWEEGVYLKDINNCLISHQHQDHSKAAEYLSNAGVNILAPARNSENGSFSVPVREDRYYPLLPGKVYEAGNYKVLTTNLSHDDVICLGYFVLHEPSGERIFFATDSMYVKANPKKVNYLMIEANYQEKYLEEAIETGRMSRHNMRRVKRTHMGLETVLQFLEAIDLSELKEIWLLHASKRNSNPEEMKEIIQQETGKVVKLA